MLKNILWDFDGVILDSMKVRDLGFEQIFKDYNENQVAQLIDYHRKNGGLSRYVKIQYFYEQILGKKIDDQKILKYAMEFSQIMRKKLIDKKNLISDSVQFIEDNYQKYNFHIVSGSDQEELRYLNSALGLTNFFLSIHGSPTPKKKLVSDLMLLHNYKREETCLIGDSINDYEAANINKIDFYGYNNNKLLEEEITLETNYIKSFKNFGT